MDEGVGLMIFMGVVLKIPVGFACWLVYWAIKAEPDAAEAPEDGGSGDRFGRFRRRPKRPRNPRRGPHSPGSLALPCPDEGSSIRVVRRPARPLTASGDGGRRHRA
jgi:hypothetical protein